MAIGSRAIARVETAAVMWWRAAARSSYPVDSWMSASDYFEGMQAAYFAAGLRRAAEEAEFLRQLAFTRACEL